MRVRVNKMAVLITLAVAIVGVVAFLPIPPVGRFWIDDMSSQYGVYYELSDGKVEMVILTGGSSALREPLGRYFKQNGYWILEAKTERVRLTARVWGLKQEKLDGTWSKWFRRAVRTPDHEQSR